MDNEGRLISQALNLHGIFFKKSTRNTLQKINGITILAEEYPVSSYEDGSRIDLLIKFNTGKSEYIIPIECKRGYSSRKKWLFFEDPDKNTKLIYAFNGKELVVGDAAALKEAEICMEGLELDVEIMKKYSSGGNNLKNSASTEKIWDACKQICKGLLGFLIQELELRGKTLPQDSFKIFPLLITTAPLYVTTVDVDKIDNSTGNYNEDLEMREVPWLIARYPFIPPTGAGIKHLQIIDDKYTDVATRALRSKEGIVVLNTNHVVDFFEILKGIN